MYNKKKKNQRKAQAENAWVKEAELRMHLKLKKINKIILKVSFLESKIF